jgi:flagellar biosynthesis protein FlhG
MSAKIFSIGAGKGGVGKSFISANLGITLVKQHHSVLVVDLDFSGANLHTHLGCKPTSPTIQSFFKGEAPLVSLVQPTSVTKLSFVQGGWDEWEHTPIDINQIRSLVTEAKNLPFDYVIFDLGPGHSDTNLELFSLSDEKILITSPEPTSIEKTYRFLEYWLFRTVSQSATPMAKAELHKVIKEFRNSKKHAQFSFRNYLSQAPGISLDHFDEMKLNPIRIILNGTRSQKEEILGFSIKSVSTKYFDLHVDFLGHIDYDNAVWHAVRDQDMFLLAKPFTTLSVQFQGIGKKLTSGEMDINPFRAVV